MEPITTRQNRLEECFNSLVSKWKSDTAFQSSISQMVDHPAYQEIIGLGEEVVPLLIRELKQNPDHWFVALKRITGEDPVDIGQRGNFDEMVRAWIGWGNRKQIDNWF
ncbi:MAG: hypothetical protein HY580_06430 [Nitrospinae bacterium]|nr:hypothetical protein [Nitrospinota bacterium]